MKFLRYLTFAFSLLTGFTCYGQLFILTGEVRLTQGHYTGEYQVGEPVKVSLDFSRAIALSESNTFRVPLEFAVSGQRLFDAPSSANVELLNAFSQAPWPPRDGIHAIGNTLVPGTIATFGFDFMTTQDVVSSAQLFPNGIAVDDSFYPAAGFLYHQDPARGYGFLGWTLNGYENHPAALTPVPELATYALFASVGLIGMVVARRMRDPGRRVA